MTTKIRDEFTISRKHIEAALKIKETFVRSDVQLNLDNPKAKGRRLTAVEVVCIFGPLALQTALDRGAFIIQNRSNASSDTIRLKMDKLGLSSEFLCDKLEISDADFQKYMSGAAYFPIRKLEAACAILGIEDAKISAYGNAIPDSQVRLRYYDERRGDVKLFDQSLVEKISEQSWKIGKIEYLNALISALAVNNIEAVRGEKYIDSVYVTPNNERPTVAKGKEIAISLRRALELKKINKKAIRVTDALSQVGADCFADNMEEPYCGMTLISAWSGKRVVVTNTRGENSRQSVRRFTLAHELAHAASDPEDKFVVVKVGGTAGKTAGSVGVKGSRDLPELRANSFAANFLAPDDEVVASIEGRPNENAIDVVCDDFAISRSAAKWRLVSLGKISSDSAVGQDSLFKPQNVDINENASTLDDRLRKSLIAARERGLIHSDTVASVLSTTELLAKK